MAVPFDPSSERISDNVSRDALPSFHLPPSLPRFRGPVGITETVRSTCGLGECYFLFCRVLHILSAVAVYFGATELDKMQQNKK